MSHDFQIAPASGERPIVSWSIRELAGYSDEAFWADLARASKQRQENIARLGEQCDNQKERATSGTFDREEDRGSALVPIKPSRLVPTKPAPTRSSLLAPITPVSLQLSRLTPTTAQKASLLAYMTLWGLLEQTCGITEAPLFDHEHGSEDGSNKGKPTLAGHPDVYFSLSHTDNAVLVAVADTPVGADIQAFRKPSERLLSRVCSNEERRALEGLDDQGKALAFAQIWTRKEAFLKMKGQGIRSLHDLKRKVPQNSISEEGASIENGFAWSICAEPDTSINQ